MGNEKKEEKVFLVTGGSGYVGQLLLERLMADGRAQKIIVIDKDDLSESLKTSNKIIFINKNLIDGWEQEIVDLEKKNNFKITDVVHLAWQIRTMYGKQKLQNLWNIFGAQKVFEYVRNTESVKTFIHFSTVASYGAFKENSFDKVFLESDKFRKTNYLYAEEKRIVEENLDKIKFKNKNIFVIRPASITGKKGRERTGFGLQSALLGKIESTNFIQNLIFKIIKKVLNFMPATKTWARQFVHEDDIVNAILVMCFTEKKFENIEKYNLCPESLILADEMGQMLNKNVVYIHPQIVRVLCFLAWHLTLGKVPTSSGVWKAYSYPIVVDGSKILKDFAEFKYAKVIRTTHLST